MIARRVLRHDFPYVLCLEDGLNLSNRERERVIAGINGDIQAVINLHFEFGTDSQGPAPRKVEWLRVPNSLCDLSGRKLCISQIRRWNHTCEWEVDYLEQTIEYENFGAYKLQPDEYMRGFLPG